VSPEHSLWFHVQVTLMAAPPEFFPHTVTFTELVGILSWSAHAIEHRVSSALCTSISACGAVFSAGTSACSCSSTFYPLPVNTAPPAQHPCVCTLLLLAAAHPTPATCCCTPHPCLSATPCSTYNHRSCTAPGSMMQCSGSGGVEGRQR
jgi:hypothetical protein